MSRLLWSLLAVALAIGLGLFAPTVSAAARPSSTEPVKLELTGFVDTLTCGQVIEKNDGATGTLFIRFDCLGDSGKVNWGFRMSPQMRVLIGSEPGSVTEDGMIWFKNGNRQAKNAPHLRDATYHYHGTFPAVRPGDRIEYQDYFQFRAVDGRKGTLAVAGTLYLKG